MTDVNRLVEEAVKETDNLETGEIFLVKDLFKGYVWNRLAVRDRHLLGILFLNYVSKTVDDIQTFEKTSSGQQKYKKI